MTGIIDDLRERLAAAPRTEHEGILERFWAYDAALTPVVEPGADGARLTFLWRDAQAAAVLVGINRITNNLAEGLMKRLAGTDVWHRSFRLADDWRGSYTFLVLDEKGVADLRAMEPRWVMRTIREQGRTDPRNPLVGHTHGGTASIAEMPDAPPQPWLVSAHVPRGTTTEHVLAHGRRVWVHRPFADTGTTPRPLVVVLDGEVWHRSGYAAATIDAQAATGAISTPYLLLVDSEVPRRMQDLHVDGSMSTEIVERLLPWVRTQVPVSENPADVAISGESLGGLTALKTVFDHPEVVGAAIAQSSSLWQHDMIARAELSAPVRLFLTTGRHEVGLVEHNRALVEALEALPHQLSWVEYNGGHDMAWWRGLWGDGVQQLFGSTA